MNNFQFDKARKVVVEFIWHELADHYLELVKHRIYQPENSKINQILYHLGLGIIKMIAPLLPHITEEIYQSYFQSLDNHKSIHISTWPEPIVDDPSGESAGNLIKDVIREIRHWKSEKSIPLNTELSYVGIVTDQYKEIIDRNSQDIISTIKVKNFEFVNETETELSIQGIKPVYSSLGPEFKEKSKEIVSKIQTLSPDEVHSQISNTGYFELELSDGEKIKLNSDHITLETSKQVHGRTVDTISMKDITLLVQK
jgi:valyl-tRNA synthetase